MEVQGGLFWEKHAIFVRDGIHSVADYDSTLMGVVVVVVLVVVLGVVVQIFTMG